MQVKQTISQLDKQLVSQGTNTFTSVIYTLLSAIVSE